MIRWAFYSTLSTALFYLLYLVLLKRDKWLQISRWYLMVTLTFSLLYPLWHLPRLFVYQEAEPLSFVSTGIPSISVVESTASHTNGLIWIYVVGVAIMIFVLLVQQGRVGLFLRSKTYERRGLVRLATPHDSTPPFSFFNWVVVGTEGLTAQELDCILTHEQLHVRQHHSFDVLYMRILCSLAWFNPLAWMMMRGLREVHEYLADSVVVQRYGNSNYYNLLYREATGIGYGRITNNFLSNNIKNRIKMMKTQRSRFGAWKTIAALPVAVWLLLVGCQPAAAQSPVTKTTTTGVKTAQKASTKSNAPAAQAQPTRQSQPQTTPTSVSSSSKAEQSSVKAGPDVEPQFPRGVEAMRQYMVDNLKYPPKAKEAGLQGRVFVRFTIDTDGSIYNVEVIRGIGGGCDEEAVRVVKAMPKWNPAIDNGKPVAVSYYLPIVFQLQ